MVKKEETSKVSLDLEKDVEIYTKENIKQLQKEKKWSLKDTIIDILNDKYKPKKNILKPFKREKGKHHFIFIVLFASLFTIFSLPLVSSELILEPSSISDDDLIVSETYSYPINITNTFPFTIHNITFSSVPISQFPFIAELGVNQTVTRNIQIQLNEQGAFEYQSTVYFYYLGIFQENPIQYNAFVTDIGFSPSQMTIRQQDGVTWKNTGNIAHEISSPYFTELLQPNETFSYTFNEISQVVVEESVFGWIQLINVLSNSQDEPIHNQNYDKIFHLYLSSQYTATNLSMTLLENNFTVNNGEETQGLIWIKNNGEEMADNIHLSANYPFISFSQNDFDVSIGGNKYIPFTIAPDFLFINQTDRTYSVKITAKGTNTASYEQTLEVFVPLDSSLSEFSGLDWEELVKLLEYYQSIFSNQSNKTIYVNGTGKFPINVTDESLYNALLNFGITKGMMDTLAKQFSDVALAQDTITTNQETINQDNTAIKDEQKQINIKLDNLNITIILIAILIFGTLLGGAFWIFSGESNVKKWLRKTLNPPKPRNY